MLVNVRFEAHYGLKSDIAPRPIRARTGYRTKVWHTLTIVNSCPEIAGLDARQLSQSF